MKISDLMQLRAGDKINLPMDQVRTVEHPFQNKGSQSYPVLVCSVTEAWYDAKYRQQTNTVYHDDVISIESQESQP